MERLKEFGSQGSLSGVETRIRARIQRMTSVMPDKPGPVDCRLSSFKLKVRIAVTLILKRNSQSRKHLGYLLGWKWHIVITGVGYPSIHSRHTSHPKAHTLDEDKFG